MLILLSGNHIFRTTALLHLKLSTHPYHYLLFIILFYMAAFLLLSLLRKELGLLLHTFNSRYENLLKSIMLQTWQNQMQFRIILFPGRLIFQVLILSTALIMYSLANRCCFDFSPFLTHNLVLTTSLCITIHCYFLWDIFVCMT